MNYLFLCKYNRFRSKIAEAYFKQVNSQDQVKSAGLIQGKPIDEEIKKVAQESDLTILGEPQGLDDNLLLWADKIIVVANDVPVSILGRNNPKVIRWEIPDVDEGDYLGRLETIKVIKEKVDLLARNSM